MRTQSLYEQYQAGMKAHEDHFVLVEAKPGQYVTFDYTAAMLQSFSFKLGRANKRLQAILDEQGLEQLLGLQFKVVVIASGGAA